MTESNYRDDIALNNALHTSLLRAVIGAGTLTGSEIAAAVRRYAGGLENGRVLDMLLESAAILERPKIDFGRLLAVGMPETDV